MAQCPFHDLQLGLQHLFFTSFLTKMTWVLVCKSKLYFNTGLEKTHLPRQRIYDQTRGQKNVLSLLKIAITYHKKIRVLKYENSVNICSFFSKMEISFSVKNHLHFDLNFLIFHRTLHKQVDKCASFNINLFRYLRLQLVLENCRFVQCEFAKHHSARM